MVKNSNRINIPEEKEDNSTIAKIMLSVFVLCLTLIIIIKLLEFLEDRNRK
jgi:hypothetical protein